MLKNPPLGMENMTQPTSWRWFHLMDEAMTGRLAGTANIIQPSPLDEDERPDVSGESFSGLSVVETGTLEGVRTLGDVLQLSGIEVCGDMEPVSRSESPADGGDGEQVRSPECEPTSQPVINRSQAAVLYATLLPDCTPDTNRTPSSSGHTVREDAEVDGKLVELQREWQALEREQAELDRELIALERNRELLDRDMATVDRDRAIIERDRAAVERDRAAVERDRAAVERDRLLLDRDRAFLDRDRAFQERDRAFLERDRMFLDRAREDLERERALLRREREGPAGDGHQAEITTEKEVVLHTRFYQNLRAADVDPDQLETRQRLVLLFQKLVEKL